MQVVSARTTNKLQRLDRASTIHCTSLERSHISASETPALGKTATSPQRLLHHAYEFSMAWPRSLSDLLRTLSRVQCCARRRREEPVLVVEKEARPPEHMYRTLAVEWQEYDGERGGRSTCVAFNPFPRQSRFRPASLARDAPLEQPASWRTQGTTHESGLAVGHCAAQCC
jgi:hypothetical protein